MSEENKANVNIKEQEDYREYVFEPGEAKPFMNRKFCSYKERVVYILKSATGSFSMGKYDTDGVLFLYEILGLDPYTHGNAQMTLTLYDLFNDPISALIIDKMRTRWGKFKPFQYFALVPNIILSVISCFLPVICDSNGLNALKD